MITLLLAFYGAVIKTWMCVMQFPILLTEIVNSDKSDVVSRASREMLLFHFNEQPTLAHSDGPLATRKIARTSKW